MTEGQPTSPTSPEVVLPISLRVHCNRTIFQSEPVEFDRWAPLNYLIGPNGTGKTTLFSAIMDAARGQWPNRVKILGTGRLGPLEKSVAQWIGDPASRLFHEENIEAVYNTLHNGMDTAHQAFQLLEKRLDLQIRVLGFLRHVFKKTLHFKQSRKGLMIYGGSLDGSPYQIIDECHGLKELITILTFLYDDTFTVLGIDEPELHLHPQFQRFLLDELKQVAGSPGEKGKKLIFLVTHSPILLELRRLQDLASVVVFSPNSKPRRARLDALTPEEVLKVKQALPSFHAGQRELLFCSTPILVEGSTDAAVLLNVATKLELPIGAAGLGIAPMGGKYQLLAYRALLNSLAKANARFILDMDAAITPQVLHCLDSDERVVTHLASVGAGDKTLSKVCGDLITLLKSFAKNCHTGGQPLLDVQSDADGALPDAELGYALRSVAKVVADGAHAIDRNTAQAILGKFDLIRAAARAANVLILSKGPIEAYFDAKTGLRISDFAKQEAFQAELDSIWQNQEAALLKTRYGEMLSFIEEAGFLHVPLSEMAREPIANLVHMMQTEIRLGRIKTFEEAKSSARAEAEGYWQICELVSLTVHNETAFSGSIKMKDWFGNEQIQFDDKTTAYSLTIKQPTAQPNASA